MPSTEQRIRAVLAKHHVHHLATAGEGGSQATPLFYALIEGLSLVWISDPLVLHSKHIAAEQEVSLSVASSSPKVGQVLGVQMRGMARCLEAKNDGPERAAYFKRHPAARALVLAKPGHRFYRFDPQWARLVDIRFGRNRSVEWSHERGS